VASRWGGGELRALDLDASSALTCSPRSGFFPEYAGFGTSGSVMIPRLQEVDPVIADPVDHTVLLSNAPGPTAGQQVSQWLGLAHACEWVAQRRLHQIENSKRRIPFGLDLVAQIFAEFRMKDGVAANCSTQRASPAAIGLRPRAWSSQVPPAAARSTNAGHSGESGADAPFQADLPAR